MEAIKTVYLSLGSDLGNKVENLQKAIDLITETTGEVKKVSSIYQSEPLGFESNTLFYNCCIELTTKLSPFKLLNVLQEIELQIGRKEKSKNGNYSSRIIDIDIILVEDIILQEDELIIPHKHFRERNFVLVPLAEIASNYIDPTTQLTIEQLKKNSSDNSIVSRIDTPISI